MEGAQKYPALVGGKCQLDVWGLLWAALRKLKRWKWKGGREDTNGRMERAEDGEGGRVIGQGRGCVVALMLTDGLIISVTGSLRSSPLT